MSSSSVSRIVIKLTAAIEVLIGLSISLNFLIPALTGSHEFPGVLYTFVIITSLISVIIGIGLLRHNKWARKLLLFFAGYVLFSKILLASGLMEFKGNTIDFMSIRSKDILSFAYHLTILIVFNLKSVKKELK
jgi:hypothetical protein